MVERKICEENEIENKYRKTGVVVFIFNRHGQILLVQETGTHDTDGAQPNNFSTICETTKPGEEWPQTIVRGLYEELGVKKEVIGKFMINTKGGVLGESAFSSDVLARVVVLHWLGNPEEALSLKGDGEIKIVGWIDPTQAMHYKLRPGVKKILLECLQKGYFAKSRPDNLQSLAPLSVESLKKAANMLIKK